MELRGHAHELRGADDDEPARATTYEAYGHAKHERRVGEHQRERCVQPDEPCAPEPATIAARRRAVGRRRVAGLVCRTQEGPITALGAQRAHA